MKSRSFGTAGRPTGLKRLKELEVENARLERIVADQTLEMATLREVSREIDEPGESAPEAGMLSSCHAGRAGQAARIGVGSKLAASEAERLAGDCVPSEAFARIRCSRSIKQEPKASDQREPGHGRSRLEWTKFRRPDSPPRGTSTRISRSRLAVSCTKPNPP